MKFLIALVILFHTLVVNANSCDYSEKMSIAANVFQQMGGEWKISKRTQYELMRASGVFRALFIANDRWKDQEKWKSSYPEGSKINENYLYVEAWGKFEPGINLLYAGCLKIEDEHISKAHNVSGFNFSNEGNKYYLSMVIWKPGLEQSNYKIEILPEFINPTF